MEWCKEKPTKRSRISPRLMAGTASRVCGSESGTTDALTKKTAAAVQRANCWAGTCLRLHKRFVGPIWDCKQIFGHRKRLGGYSEVAPVRKRIEKIMGAIAGSVLPIRRCHGSVLQQVQERIPVGTETECARRGVTSLVFRGHTNLCQHVYRFQRRRSRTNLPLGAQPWNVPK